MIAKIWDSIVGHFYIVLLWLIDLVCGPADE